MTVSMPAPLSSRPRAVPAQTPAAPARPAGGAAPGHDHAAHAHPHGGAAPAAVRIAPSLLRLSLAGRLLVAMLLLAPLWIAVALVAG